jgi:hypothetical protein
MARRDAKFCVSTGERGTGIHLFPPRTNCGHTQIHPTTIPTYPDLINNPMNWEKISYIDLVQPKCKWLILNLPKPKTLKTNLIWLFLIIGCFACTMSNQSEMILDEDTTNQNPDVVDETSDIDWLQAIWVYDYNSDLEDFELKKQRILNIDTLKGETLEAIINHSFPKVQIIFNSASNDTAYIAIPDSKVLTQQMGSAGAEGFMRIATYTFTELKGIRYVSFQFEEGDHGIPGVYHRKSWNKTKFQ